MDILLYHSVWKFALESYGKTYEARNQPEISNTQRNFKIMFHIIVYKVVISSFFGQYGLGNSSLLPFWIQWLIIVHLFRENYKGKFYLHQKR